VYKKKNKFLFVAIHTILDMYMAAIVFDPLVMASDSAVSLIDLLTLKATTGAQ